jgi:hypothetical protein
MRIKIKRSSGQALLQGGRLRRPHHQRPIGQQRTAWCRKFNGQGLAANIANNETQAIFFIIEINLQTGEWRSTENLPLPILTPQVP